MVDVYYIHIRKERYNLTHLIRRNARWEKEKSPNSFSGQGWRENGKNHGVGDLIEC